MRFCSGCGKTISILNNSDAEFCPDCVPENKLKTTVPKQKAENGSDLDSTTFSIKDGKLVLESDEGWLLWSGDLRQQHSFETIKDRASRILKIRRRQKK